MTEEPPPPARQPPPRLLVWGASLAIAYLGYQAVEMLVGFVQRPLQRGSRTGGLLNVQVLLLAIAALLVPVIGRYSPRVGSLPRWVKWLLAFLVPLPICLLPVPALFFATIDKLANQREIEIYRAASAPLRAALEACRKAEGRYPADPEQCLNRAGARLELRGGWWPPRLAYYSEGHRYALGFRGSDPEPHRIAEILFWSDSGAWSWHDHSGFVAAVRGHRSGEPMGVSCDAGTTSPWSCRAPAN